MGEEHLILVVDDDPLVRRGICAYIERLGHDYASAASCAEAVALAEARSPSCAIIDLGLPDEDGLSLLPIISQLNPCCVFTILTGDTRPETIVEAMREGAFDYLVKPVSFPAFRAAVSRALHHSEVVRERDRLLEELVQERELLKVRVEEANHDLREHANRVELANTRKEILLQLNSLKAESYTEEDLFRCLFEQLASNVP
ncbi:MAG: response regulator, partial [Nitrospiraceae bacterium]|nr:response regulator [Nitrospiraceae bacterium]